MTSFQLLLQGSITDAIHRCDCTNDVMQSFGVRPPRRLAGPVPAFFCAFENLIYIFPRAMEIVSSRGEKEMTYVKMVFSRTLQRFKEKV